MRLNRPCRTREQSASEQAEPLAPESLTGFQQEVLASLSVAGDATVEAEAGAGKQATSSRRLDFRKLGEKAAYEREHGPRLDQEWAEGRASGTIPTYPCETRDAVLTGSTFAVKEQIKHLLGKWDGARKAWVVPALGAGYCCRSNFDYVQRIQSRLDELKAVGVIITYERP